MLKATDQNRCYVRVVIAVDPLPQFFIPQVAAWFSS